MKLSVVIVSYNVKYFLEQCLHSVVRATASLSAEIIVVDNNSTDGSLEYLLPDFPGVIFIKNEENLGFGRANNLALGTARGEYVLFLNPDTLVPEDCFVKCTRFLDARPKAGALGIRMLDGRGQFLPESKRSFPTTATAFYKLMGLSGLFPASQRFNRYSLGHLDEHHDHRVEVLAGAFMMVRKTVLDKIGGFDEAFFMYGEDIDLSYRIIQAGYENWYFAGSSIIHFKGESTRKESTPYLKMFYQAMIVFVNKHYRGKGAWMIRAMLKTGIGLRGAASWLYSTASQKGEGKKYRNKIIIGNDKAFRECCNIIHNASRNIEEKIIHHECGHTGLNDIISLKKEMLSHNAAELVLCNCNNDFSTIIHIMENLGPQYSYRFHAEGSNSIVGSDSKESIGETLASH